MAGPPPHFDPALISSYLMAAAVTPVYNTLTRCKPGPLMQPYDPWSCQLEGDLAQSWSFSADNLQLTLKLHQGVRFQDLPPVNGREFTAADAKYSLERYARQPDLQGLFEDLAAIETPDKYTLVLRFKRPSPYFVYSPLAESRIMMLAKEIEEQDGDFRNRAIGTGPFILKSYERNVRLVYERNPNYFKPGLPYLDGFVRQIIPDPAAYEAAFFAGQVDDWQVPIDKVETLRQREPSVPIFRRNSFRGYSTYHVAMRLDKPPFSDKRVRLAMAYAIDQNAIIRVIYRGNARIGINLPWLAAFESEPGPEAYGPLTRFNPQEARRLLAEAGYPNGFEAKLEWTQYGPYDPDLLQLIQQQLGAVGIRVTLQRLETITFITRFYSNAWEELAYGFIQTFPQDWTMMVYLTRSSGKGQNVWGIKDPEMDQVAQQIKEAAGDPARSRALFRRMWELDLDRLYFIPLPDPPTYNAFRSYVHNWITNDRTQFPDWGARQFEIIWTSRK
jgi:peptide/nickel transport system substrate-binding protein